MVEIGIWIAGAIAGFAVGRLISDRQYQKIISDLIRQSDGLLFTPVRGQLTMIKNRVREVRKQRGLTLERLAELAEMSAGHIFLIERHEKGWSLESLPRIAKALGVSPEELLDASGAWQQIPVIAVVGQDLWGHALSGGHTSNGSAASVKVPSAYGDVIAVSVAGPALYPRYSSGEVIIAHEPSVLPVDAVGKECVIVTEDNRVGVKFVQKAAEGVIYFSHNEPPASNLSVSRCYPIAYVLRS